MGKTFQRLGGLPRVIECEFRTAVRCHRLLHLMWFFSSRAEVPLLIIVRTLPILLHWVHMSGLCIPEARKTTVPVATPQELNMEVVGRPELLRTNGAG